jgi:hypothetical protein
MPGAYRQVRRFDAIDAGAAFTETNFRTDPDWWPAADLLTVQERLDAAARGEIKQINVISRAANSIDMAEANPVTGAQFYRAESATEVIGFTANYSNRMGKFQAWFRSPAGATSWSVEVFFDIPPPPAT